MTQENNNTNVDVRTCGVCTCIHCISNTCAIDDCDMYFEKKLIQEG